MLNFYMKNSYIVKGKALRNKTYLSHKIFAAQ